MRYTCYVAAFALQFALSMAFGPTAWTLPKRITCPLHRGFIVWEGRERRAWQTIEKGCLGPLYRDQYKRYSRAIAASIDAAVDSGDESGIPKEGRGPWLDNEGSNQGVDVKNNERDNYYEVLGLAMGASSAEIKDAYRQLAMKSHPDTDGEGTSREVFEKITAAYDVLSDPGKRSTYDQGLSMKKFVDKVKAANWSKTLQAVANLGVVATSVGVSVGVAAAEPLAKGIEDMAVKGFQSATLPSTMTEAESLRREQQMVQRAKAEAERKLEGLRRRAEEDLAEAADLDEASSARLEEQRQWNVTLSQRQEEMQKTQKAMADVECRIAKAGEELGERKILEQEATEVLRKAKAAREAFLQASAIAQRRVSTAEATAAVAEQRLSEAMKALEDSRNALHSASEQATKVESQRSKVFGEQDAAQDAVEKAKEMLLSGRAALSECRDKEANVQANLREKTKQERAAAARVKELGDQAEAARTRALRLRANAEDTTAAAAVEAETVESARRREANLRAKEAAARAVEEAASAAAQEEKLRCERKEAAAAVEAAVARARELEEKEAEAVRAARAAKEAAQRATENVLAVAAESKDEENSSGVQSESGDMSILGEGEGAREEARSGSPEEQGAGESVAAEGTMSNVQPSNVQQEGVGRGMAVDEKRQRSSKVPSWVGVMNPRNAE